MARKKKKEQEKDMKLDFDLEEKVSEAEKEVSEKKEEVEEEKPVKKQIKSAKLPKMDKGIAKGKLTFDIFFAYCIKKYPKQIKVDHYRAMKDYLRHKGYAMIDTKQGFSESFKAYGLNIE